MYSTLAGFVEPGESLEEAVAREVFEEAGVRVGRVHYHSSQPWPFPASIMLGFYAEALTERSRIDADELEDARWFTRDEIRDHAAHGFATPARRQHRAPADRRLGGRRLAMPALFTIGYQGSTLASVLAELRAAGVAHLIDVRAVPQSRKPGFSKRLLCASVEAEGMGYTHLRALGTPKAGRDAVRHGNVAAMQRIFRAHMQGAEAEADLARAAAIAAEAPACLLCFERDHAECHRTIVAELLGLAAHHLAPAD